MVTKTAITAYLETLLWSETLNATDEDGNPATLTAPESGPAWSAGDTFEDGTALDQIVDVSDLAELSGGANLLDDAREDLEGFAAYVEETLGFDPFEAFEETQVAHDFALSRNGHGAGFFDGEYTHDGESVSDALQDAAKTFGTFGLDLWLKSTDKGDVLHIESHG